MGSDLQRGLFSLFDPPASTLLGIQQQPTIPPPILASALAQYGPSRAKTNLASACSAPADPFALRMSLLGNATAPGPSLNSLLGIQSPTEYSLGMLARGLSIATPPPQILPPHKWIAVWPRFAQFHRNVLLTQQQRTDAFTKRGSVVSCLNRAYYDTSSPTDHSFLIGSWGKDTATRPPRDVDLYFLLPAAVYHRFQKYAWVAQSALLQEVKDHLATTFSDTSIRGDRQVVVVKFGTITVEVAPAFALDGGGYLICDTTNGGRYTKTNPWAEVAVLDVVDAETAGNLRPLIRMLKAWQANCAVDIKSFHLELLATQFLLQCDWRLKDWFYFDWITRDFFEFLARRPNWVITVPGTTKTIQLGDAWQSRAQTALGRARRACELERDNHVQAAGEEWQKIFGLDVPRVV
jgi:Second Messenger Oligonucleotide or Dinucleotide Synthetase domain